MSLYEKISLIISSISLLSLIGLMFQLYLSRKQTRDSHDEIRRSKTIDVLMAWSNFQNKATFYAVKIVESFNADQCKSLVQVETFEVSEEIKRRLCHLCELAFGQNNSVTPCNKCEKKCENSSTTKYFVVGPVLYELRWQAVRYLNILESILQARNLGIVDNKTIQLEFEGLGAAQSQNALEIFRTAMIDNSADRYNPFPAIETFCQEIHRTPASGKKELH